MKAGWKVGPLEDFIESFIVPQRDKPKVFEGSIPWCRIEDIDGVYLSKSKSGKVVSQQQIEGMPLRVFPKGTVIVSCSADLGRCAIAAVPLVTNQTFIGLVPKEHLDSKYLYYLMTSRAVELNTAATGATITYLSKDKFKRLQTAIPPLSEQRRVIAILDEAFEGIATAKANSEMNLRLAGEVLQSHLTTFFYQLNIQAGSRIVDFCQVFDGPHATPKTVDSGPIFLGISALQDGVVNLGETRHVTPEDFLLWTRRVKPEPGDVVFSYETRLGQAAIIPEGLECCLGRRMGLVRTNRAKLDPRFFLFQYLSGPFQSFLTSKIMRGATVDRISIKDFPSFPIWVPSLEEQARIIHSVARLQTETNRILEMFDRKISILDEFKQSLLHRAFNGGL